MEFREGLPALDCHRLEVSSKRAGSRQTKSLFVGAVFAMGVFSSSAPAQADSQRSGFTLQLGAGAGWFSSIQRDGDNVILPALAPLSISVGGFVSDRIALLARASMVVFRYSPMSSQPETSRLGSQTPRMIFAGSSLQYWTGDRFALEAGVGLTLLGTGPVEAQLNRGIGFPIRLSWTFAETRVGPFSAVFEILPSFFARSETTVSSNLGIQWQWL